MKRLLVPTDFSPNAECALRVAVEIAARNAATIILYHIYMPVESPFIDDKEKRDAHNVEAETIALKRMQRLKKKVLKNNTEINITCLLGRTPLVNNILGFAAHNHIDLIVMGTRGATGIKKVLIGSVAATIAQKTDIPLLLVPEEFSPKVLSGIVFASDFHPYDEVALEFTVSFAKLFKTTITIAHVIDPFGSEKKVQQERNDFDSYAFYMQRKFSKAHLQFELIEKEKGKGKIETISDKCAYDLLVMVKRKKNFYQKIFSTANTKNTACIARKPLLVIPPMKTV